jgi:hypothetical protein
MSKLSEDRAGGRPTPPICTGCKRTAITGNPDPAHVSTSHIERQNLTMGMSMRRFSRLTNAFSKKAENHEGSDCPLHPVHNFGRVHPTLRATRRWGLA